MTPADDIPTTPEVTWLQTMICVEAFQNLRHETNLTILHFVHCAIRLTQSSKAYARHYNKYNESLVFIFRL